MSENNGCLLSRIAEKGEHHCFIRNIEKDLQNINKRLLHNLLSEEAKKHFHDSEKILVCLGNHVLFIFRVRAIAEALVYRQSDWITFLSGKDFFREIMPVQPEMAFNYLWTFIPCLFANQNDSYVRFLLCGVMRTVEPELIVPAWARNMMDDDFYNSIQDAQELSLELLKKDSLTSSENGFSLCCLPVGPQSASSIFNGDSAGLPIWLGIRNLLDNMTYPMKIAATGKISRRRIGSVGLIQEKKYRASKYGFIFFIYPAAVRRVDCSDVYPMECFQVGSPGEAFLLSVLDEYDGDTLNKVHDCLSSSEKFASLCGHFPEIGFELHSDRIQQIAIEVSTSLELFKKFIHSFKAIVRSAKYKNAGYIASIFDEIVESSTMLDSVTKLEWYCLNLEMANHCGNVELADKLSDKAKIVLKDAVKTPEGRNHLNWLSNFEFVHKRHNYYDFRPELPNGFSEVIEKTEQIFAITSAGIDGASDPALASIYGTIAQNYAFCGPAFLDESVYYSKKAIETFGGIYAGKIPEQNRNDCLRQYNYMTYAFLDAGDYYKAEKHLCFYFEKNCMKEVLQNIDTFSEWQHALVIRFISDTENIDLYETYSSFCSLYNYAFITDKHPWQLWYYNMALSHFKFGRNELAKTFASKSFDLCKSDNSYQTINIMGLLPLSFLSANNRVSDSYILKEAAVLIENATALNPVFFAGLKNMPTETALRKLSSDPMKYFPFSYR